jgi:hypothetical protein
MSTRFTVALTPILNTGPRVVPHSPFLRFAVSSSHQRFGLASGKHSSCHSRAEIYRFNPSVPYSGWQCGREGGEWGTLGMRKSRGRGTAQRLSNRLTCSSLTTPLCWGFNEFSFQPCSAMFPLIQPTRPLCTIVYPLVLAWMAFHC